MPRQMTTEELFGSSQPGQGRTMTTEELFGGQQPMTQDDYPEPARKEYTPVEAGAMGTAQGALFDFGDELYGGGKALWDIATGPDELKDLVTKYKEHRDKAREELKLAQKDQPAAYTGGQIAGSVGSAFIPGLGWMNAAKGAGYLGKGGVIAKGALGGGIAGAGISEADSVGGLMRDVREGAIYGGAAGGALHTAGKAAKLIDPKWIGKKGANVILNTPEELTEKYLKYGPDKVKKAPLRHELVEPWNNQKRLLKKRVIEGSQEAKKELEGIDFRGPDLGKKAGGMAGRIEKDVAGFDALEPDKVSAAKWLRDIEAEYKGHPTVPAEKLKKHIQSMGRKNYGRKVGPGQFDPVDTGIKKQFQGELNQTLKKSSPAYAEDMPEVARLTRLLDRANELGKDKSMPNVFRRTQTDDYGTGQLLKKTMEEVDDAVGTKFMDKVAMSATREAFDKSITNGSMNVQKFRGILEGYAPLAFLKPFAGFLGAAVDKYGRKITMNALDLTIKLDSVMKGPGPQAFKKALMPIKKQAERGNYASMIALQILEQTHSDHNLGGNQ